MHRTITLRSVCLVLCAVTAWLVLGAESRASNETMLDLLRILRDRGAITAEEYEELRLAAEASDAAAPVAPKTGEPAIAAAPPPAETPAASEATEAAVNKALAKKWYTRFALRGYTQFRFTQVSQGEGEVLEVPADRSVNENESFIIRRGRFILSGDATSQLALYAQVDFNASTGASDYSLQMRDLYADVFLDAKKTFRLRFGQSKVPFGWVNLQSSQNRAPAERPDPLNLAVEGERDIGMYLMWATPTARQRFRELVSEGLKGSGDYGSVAVGLYSGQGLNRSDQNGEPHAVARWSYPFKLGNGQFFEVGAQAYYGKFVSPTQAITQGGVTFTPSRPDDGVIDTRVGLTAVWYPQPFGVEAEWNIGHGPMLTDDLQSVTSQSLNGGYVQLNYRKVQGKLVWFPFVRWQRYDGGRKFAKNAPHMNVEEIDFGLELGLRAELELLVAYTHTFDRTRTSAFPYEDSRGADRVGFQLQWNY